MCGLVGFFSSTQPRSEIDSSLRLMAAALRHRGPDDEGTWADADVPLGLGFRRLSILDLSPTGHQPMLSASGRFAIIYNGEIYNFLELRAELEQGGAAFKSTGDTEVILALIERDGIEAAIRRLNGMFAFAVWDIREKALWLARDPLGIKPLHFGWCGSTLFFGSEVRSFRPHAEFRAKLSMDAVGAYLRWGCVPAPLSIYENFRKVRAGTLVRIRPDKEDPCKFSESVYWSAGQKASDGQASRLETDEDAAIARLEELLKDAVRRQMISDVPLGAFLSGGVDSSLVTALMQSQSSSRIKTFSIGFDERDYNEAPYAEAVARHLGTDHTTEIVTPRKAMDVIPMLGRMYDEPFADSSQIPTFLVSQLARQHVTVTLSGDGGDELFGGYERYAWAKRLFSIRRRIPRPLLRLQSGLMQRLPAQVTGTRVKKVFRILDSSGKSSLYSKLLWTGLIPAEVMTSPADPAGWAFRWREDMGDIEQMMLRDAETYLTDDILVKLDQASMAVGLESRVPLLDHRIYEFAWQMPVDWRCPGNEPKRPLKQILYRYVPRDLIDRPKKGFAVPIDRWIKGPLRDWAEDLLSEKRIKENGVLHAAPIRRAWQDHLAGRSQNRDALWSVLMLQQWLDVEGG